jgi:HD-GYP domain-containing protein (c-di-GMP phosphodiesterase class II)
VADVFDALTSERQYKKAFSLERTMAMMEAERGRHFDPAVLERFKPIAGKLHELLAGKESAELQEDLQTIINTYFAPEEAVADALKTLAPGNHPPPSPRV